MKTLRLIGFHCRGGKSLPIAIRLAFEASRRDRQFSTSPNLKAFK